MGNETFIDFCKQLVTAYVTEQAGEPVITEDAVFCVWLSKALQNNKALLSTTLSDGMYYEITFNGDKGEAYFDAYKKIENRAIKLDLKK